MARKDSPHLPDNIWQMLSEIIVRTAPYDCLKLAMTCKEAHAAIMRDTDFWMSFLRRTEKEHYDACKAKGRFEGMMEQPFSFLALSAPPDFIRGRPYTIQTTRGDPYPNRRLLHTIPDDQLFLAQ